MSQPMPPLATPAVTPTPQPTHRPSRLAFLRKITKNQVMAGMGALLVGALLQVGQLQDEVNVLKAEANVAQTVSYTSPVRHHGPTRAQVACRKAARRDLATCLKLYSRKATTVENPDGSQVSTPAGSVLVAECVKQYRGVELHYCLNQPAS